MFMYHIYIERMNVQGETEEARTITAESTYRIELAITEWIQEEIDTDAEVITQDYGQQEYDGPKPPNPSS